MALLCSQIHNCTNLLASEELTDKGGRAGGLGSCSPHFLQEMFFVIAFFKI